ncbi:IS6 family transposase [Flavobacterium hiemivividum]|uniref:IS6 family transposase n=1 Tax=Flavobacterium hiemivividum TaxID=2541734 RepID=A0A4R5CRS3_9FLAO|nr:IS6 family transposase [Flavobacterium hiemivividum]
MITLAVNHAAIQPWIFKFAPLIESQIKKRKNRVGASWRVDEIYIKVKGIWCYLYRAVDKLGNTIDFLLTKRSQRMSAQSFQIKAINNSCRSRVINIDKSGSNISAIWVYNKQ